MAKWAAAGHRIVAICATDGSLGAAHDEKKIRAGRCDTRKELTAALAVLGAEPPVMLGFPDGFLRENAAKLRERLIYHFRRLRADRV